MAVIDTLKKLEDLVADASHLPFSDKALVNDDEIVHLVEELRMDLPKELNRAAEIMQEQENIIGAQTSSLRKARLSFKRRSVLVPSCIRHKNRRVN